MKEIMLKITKKYRFTAFLQVFFIMLNIYFLTYPPKIIGKIIDLHIILLKIWTYKYLMYIKK